ncbi:ABC transporter permease subunit [Tolumonas osonensis]|uniref:Phosphate transport system permease protein n=1 Tax=Tolumonas osonensis TaxID=675874 RepID=A0A841GQY2_9GAMM|nr:ABC transporter permease subunit [Tolumonas osonensis]MBB6056033.1 phosphate transport system permease protein [Tolumonas osonensis]
MSTESINLTMAGSRKRRAKDRLASVGVTTGGILVLVALLLIFFYLLYVVKPIFSGASLEPAASLQVPVQGTTAMLGTDEQNQLGYRFSQQGDVDFFSLDPASGHQAGSVLLHQTLADNATAVAHTSMGKPLVIYGLANGQANAIQPEFVATYPEGQKRVTQATLKYPLGEAPIVLDQDGHAITHLAYEAKSDKRVFAFATETGVQLLVQAGEENFLSGEVEWGSNYYRLPEITGNIDQLILTPGLDVLLVRVGNLLSIYNIAMPDNITLKASLQVNAQHANVTNISLLSGASSLLVANDNGVISQWFEVLKDGTRSFMSIREFQADQSVRALAPEHSRKGFATLSGDNHIELFYTTNHARLYAENLGSGKMDAIALSPRNSALLIQQEDKFHVYRVHNEHPEVGWTALWSKVWYEGYPEPQFVWQSTSASDDFEPKLSLVPLAFGTLKAAFYAMLFAVPIALAGAIYAGYFMSAGMRTFVKPTVEIMAALPTVILGFLAGLWLAPAIEENLPGIVLMLVSLPLGILLAGMGWNALPRRIKERLPEGWHALILVPVVVLIGWGCVELSPIIENHFFDGNVRGFITNDIGIRFDQRNSLVVGIAMGFAVIPTIFSIAEDAVFSVPKHLTQGSLALGATPWQTLSRVVILTASPGIFSAVMMGLGRAVGETMIVLMATGNTPIMNMSIFEGLRTLAANIAVEMPESEVGSSHYRVLFLAAFVLFVFTFIFNSVAEYIRQRLRDKYSSM